MKNKYLVALLALFLPCMGAFAQCLTPTDLAFSNVTSNSATISWNGNADSYTVWYGTPPSTSHYLGYGEMTLQGALGNDTESTWTWGVMFPGETVPGNVLTKVGFFNTVNNINDITIRVYSGGDNAPGTLLLTKVVTPIPDSYQLVTLDAPLHLPAGENLWITLEETGIWLMSMTNATDPNSRWYFNGNAWTQQSVFPDKGWIIHGHVENQDYENMEWNQVSTTNESIDLAALTPETTYVVKTQAHCDQGNDSEMSDEIAFITRLFECPVPTDLTVGDVTHNTVDLNWNGESDSYKVMYRAKSQVQGSLQGFPSTTIPTGWSQKSGLLEEVLSGQGSLTNGSAWEFGEGGNVFDSHAKLNYVEGVHHWLISSPVSIADNYVLNFDLAMTMYAYCAPWDLFAVLVQDVESGQWSLLRQWDNQGSAYVLQDISHTGENVSVDLNAYTGKDVRIAFYGERIEYFWNIQIHVDNVCVVVPLPSSEWQTAVDNHPNTNYTLTGLDPETSYEVKVGGVCGTTQSHEMSTVSFITSPYIQEPTNVYLSDIDYFSANLGWTENGTSTAWQIQLDDEPPMTVNTNPYTLTGLTPDTDYVVKVRSLQRGYFSNWSVATNFTTPFYCYPPTQLAVTEGTLNSATLGWTDHGTATQWQVCINGDETHLVTVNTTHYVMTNLDAQTQYTVKVRAICGETYTEWTDELSFVPVLYCNPPTLTVNNITTSTADLSWTAITGTDSYTVNITTPVVQSTCPIITGYTATGGTAGVNTNQSYPKLVDNDKSTKWCASLDNGIYIEFHSEMEFIPTAYILTTGNDNSSYHGRNPKNWVIKAKLNASDSWTTIATVTNDNVLQDENNTDYEFTLNNTNAYRYFRFEVSAVQSGNAFQLSELRFRGQVTSFNVTDTSMPLTDLLPETDYAAKVRGNIGEMLTNWSNEVNFTTCYLPPTNLTATPKTYSSVTLSWTANSNAPEWQICLNDDENNLIDASTNPFVLTGLTQQTQYAVKVRASHNGTISDWSGNVNFTTLPYCPAPTDLSALNVTCNSMMLSWNQNGTVSNWQICLNNDESNLITTNANPYSLTGLSAQTTYSVKVRGRLGGENYSDWSESINVTTTAFYQEPTDLAATEIHSNCAVLNWTENSNANEWRICLNNDMANLMTVNTRPFTLAGLTPEHTYTAKISAYHDGSFSGWSDPISFTTLVLTPSLTVSNVNVHSADLNWTNTSGASYTVRYNQVPSVMETVIWNGFESGMGWTFGYFGTTMPATSVVYNSHNGSCGLKFVATSGCDYQVLVSPWFEECLSMELFYKTENTNETFQILFYVGNTNQSSTDEITVNSHGQWQKYTCDIPEGTTGLRIKYCGQSESALVIDDIRIFADHLEVASNTNSTQLTSLVYYKTYSAKVRTKHGGIYSEWSDAVEFTTYLPPTSVTVSDIAETEATVSWNENGDATQWQLCLNNDQNNLIEVSTNPYTLTGLTQETHYTVKIRDCHEGYNSAWCDAAEFTTLAYCTAPTDLAVDDILRYSATLSWNANSDTYKVFYRTTGEWILAAENLTENTFTFTELEAETHYEACVKGVCNGIESNASGIIGFTTLLDDIPTLTVDDITCTSAGLFWTETPGADSYTVSFNNSIEIPVNSGYTPTAANPEGSNNEWYTNLVDNNRSSKWYVHYAVNGVFGGAYIEFRSQHDFVPTGYVLTTANDTYNRPGRNPKDWVVKAKLHLDDPWTTIDSVTNDTVLQGVSLTDFEFTLDNTTPYRYFRFEVLDVKNTNDAKFQLGEMSFLGYSKNNLYIADLTPVTAYSAKVRAKKGGLNSEWSDEVNFTTLFLTPTNPTVTNIDYTSATLGWTENGGASHWQICLNDDEDNLIDADSNPFTITGLSQHTDYTVKVRVSQGVGYSSWSDIVHFATLVDVISPTLTVNNVKSTSADLNWTEIIGVDGYTVCLNDAIVSLPSQIITGYTATGGTHGNPNEDYPKLVDNDRTTKWCGSFGNGVYIEFQRESGFIPTGYILTTGNDNESKHGRNPKDWVIKAKLKEWEEWTTIVTVTDDMVLQDVNCTDFEFSLNNRAAYRYFRFEVSATQGSDVFQLGELRFLGEIPTNSLHLTNLLPETDYAAKVCSYLGETQSAWSNTVSFRTLCQPPTNLTVSDIGYSSATLDWTANSNITQWQICLNGDEEHLISTNAKPFTLTGLSQHTHYTVKVRNCQERADDEWSDEIEFTTLFDVTSPALTVNNVKSTSADLSWTENPLAINYIVSLNGAIVELGVIPTNSLHLTNLLPETDYAVKVRSDFGETQSEWSNMVYFRTLYQPPTNLTVSNIDHCSATLGWTSNSNITQWQICLNGDEEHLISTNVNPYTLTGLNHHAHYTVKVRNCQEGADDAWSDEIGFTTLFNIIAPTVTVNNITLTTAVLNWEEIIGADGYTVSVNDSIIPDPIITGYTVTDGTNGYSDNEGCAKLVDNDRSTKWCRWSNNIYIEFNSQHDFIPTGYVLTTAADAQKNPQRNPKDWVIKAKLNAGDAWTTIDSITNDNVLQAKDTTDYEFAIDNYALYRYFRFEVSAVQSGDSFQLGELRFREKTPTNSLHLTNLLPETDYAVKVRSDFGETQSEWSETVNFRTLYLPPTHLTVSDISYSSATLGWTANSNITQWQICLNGDETNLIDASTNPFVLTGLTGQTQYTVKVRNNQEGADDAWSDAIGFSTLVDIAPPTLTVSDITQTTAVLNWTEISGADGYTVSVNDSIIPDPIITGYTVTDGTNGYSDNEGCAKLVDNDRSTKWCRWSNNIYIEFNSQHDFIPTGYVLTTAADAHKNPQRNPKNWVIKAKLNAGDAWTVIATVTNDNVLQAEDTTDYEFAIDNHAAYRYFRFEVSAVQSGDSFQLGEMRFRGKTPANSRILAGLLPETNYAVKVRANFGMSFSVWSEEVSFVTFDGITFFVNGNWNDPDKWNISRVPGADDDVYIVAQAVVPAGYTAQVKHANVNDGGSITIEDSGQFIAENEVNVSMQKNISAWTTDPVGGWYFIAPPVNAEDSDYSVTGLISEIEGKDYDLYQLNATTWENYKAEGSHNHFDLERGRGYLYASEKGTEIEFVGNAMPYSETPILLSDGFNLVGNPYTFNTYVNRPYYKLNADRTDIELVNDNTVVAPCQGVLIDAEGAGQVTFTQTDQLSQNSNSGNLIVSVANQASNRGAATVVDKAVVSFNQGSRLGKFYFTEQDVNIYIPQDGKDYAVVFAEDHGEVPVNIKVRKNGTYTLGFGAQNVEFRYLHLIDHLTGNDVDLLHNPSYTFDASYADYSSRFLLVFAKAGSDDSFAFVSNGNIVVNGSGILQVIDALGRIVMSEQVSTLNSKLSTLNLTPGVYVLRLINGKDVKTQKIVLP